jgi:4-hydroxyphenylpyruvate dioxygenase-like putative hemolysin
MNCFSSTKEKENYQIIQRMGAKGFGAGNFKALF